jgi:hypothetical protein
MAEAKAPIAQLIRTEAGVNMLLRTASAEGHRRQLVGREIAALCYLGIHCGAGGQVLLPFRHRDGATSAWHLGLVKVWLRLLPGIGSHGPFYGLTDGGRRLAATLLMRTKRRRGKSRGVNQGA